MVNLEKFENTQVSCNRDRNIHKYYVYTYMINGVIKYVGRGSDANTKDPYHRARHFKGHEKHSPECLIESDNIQVTIVDHVEEEDGAQLIEANYIKAFNTVNNGWNNREELKDNKFYSLLDTFIKRDGDAAIDIKNLVHLLMQNATGEKSVEPIELAQDIISKAGVDEDKDICVISNNQFGGFNLVKELINPNVQKKSLSMIVTEEFAMKIGADDMADKEYLTINTGHENFIHQDFGSKKFDIIFMNPPFEKIGIEFIEKATELLKKGGKLITIMATDIFSPMPLKEIPEPGTFFWLNQRGFFERIEMYRHNYMGNIPRDRVIFQGFTSSCWFIWKKEPDYVGKVNTDIVNSLGEEFTYNLKGNETKIPMEPWEKIKDFVEWDITKSINFLQTEDDNKRALLHFKLFLDRAENFKGNKGLRPILVIDDTNYILDEDKFFNFISPNSDTAMRNKILYSKKIDTAINYYPLNKEYFRKIFV